MYYNYKSNLRKFLQQKTLKTCQYFAAHILKYTFIFITKSAVRFYKFINMDGIRVYSIL